MTALLLLGARLTRAGGPVRFVSVVVSCALAVALLALAWELPEAMFPTPDDPLEVNPLRGPVATMLAVIAAPVVALVLAAGRLSSEVRDRRLGTLALLGLSRRRVLLVAAVEILIPAVVGSVLGAGVFLLLRAAASVLAAAALVQPIAAGASLAAAVAGVVMLATLLALASARRLRGPDSGVGEASVLRPSLWRVVPLPIALGLLAVVFRTPREEVGSTTALVFFGAVVAAGLTVVLFVPLLGSWIARALTRSRATSVLLAGRSIETQGPAISRRVTALGVTTFVAFAAIGYLGLFESGGVRPAYIHQVEEGPQEIWVSSPGEEPVPLELIDQLSAVSGVEGVFSRPTIMPVVCAQEGDECPSVFVGTCAELALVSSVSGCVDGRAAWIVRDNEPSDLLAPTWDVDPGHAPPEAELLIPATGGSFSLPVDAVLTQDLPRTMARWLWPEDIDLFVPGAVARSHGAPGSPQVEVVAEAGSQVRTEVGRVAKGQGMNVFAPAMPDYEQVATLRVAVWTVVGASVAVALLVFAVASIDRARSGRRGRARLVAVGVPARTLRRAQALATGVPLTAAIALALGFGWLIVLTLVRIDDEASGFTPDATALIAVNVVVAVGALLISLATLPFTRAAVRAEDLRHE